MPAEFSRPNVTVSLSQLVCLPWGDAISVLHVRKPLPQPCGPHLTRHAPQAYLTFICAFGFYMFIRVTKTLGLGSYFWYGCLVLAVEVLGATTTLIYGAARLPA